MSEDARDLFNLATDSANCAFGTARSKRKLRSSILKLLVIAIRCSKQDPTLEDELMKMSEYSA